MTFSTTAVLQKIAPLWPLENFVAVNPYLGYTSTSFEDASLDLSVVGDVHTTMPLSFYRNAMNEGRITQDDIAEVLQEHASDQSVASFLHELSKQDKDDAEYPLIALVESASELDSADWTRFFTNTISSWAAAHFDRGQSIWRSGTKANAYTAWKNEASIDRNFDIMGLTRFRKGVTSLPDDHHEAIDRALSLLELDGEEADHYMHRLLRLVNGWSSYIAYTDRQAKTSLTPNSQLEQFLAILLSWEVCFLQSVEIDGLHEFWKDQLTLANKTLVSEHEGSTLWFRLLLQDAYDKASQRELYQKFMASGEDVTQTYTTKAQAIFCIDVRSEVFRRNLETVDPGIKTLGYAGFFGFPIATQGTASEIIDAQCPVLIDPPITMREHYVSYDDEKRAVRKRTSALQSRKILKSFKHGAISNFGFVSPLGLTFLPKLISDSLGWSRPVPKPDNFGLPKRLVGKSKFRLQDHDPSTIDLPFEQQVSLAKNALKGMSLSSGLAPYVIIVGHGSNTVNNPHGSGLDCGACGGHNGAPNAKLAAQVFNNAKVREALEYDGIHIGETIFIAALHDTTTDNITLLNTGDLSEKQMGEVASIFTSFDKAGTLSRKERSKRMVGITESKADRLILKKSKDWSEVRPEWGLAGCSTFVVAPRHRTSGIDLEGRSFLHSYDWTADKDFGVLEQIMTAPIIVTSWINLQYYASVVDTQKLGAGNKALHNVTAGIGVIEGAQGDLRTGLPWQSVHDGEHWQHLPERLNVVIEAPIEAINQVLRKHPDVRALFDNRWINLLCLDESGQIGARYTGSFEWREIRMTA